MIYKSKHSQNFTVVPNEIFKLTRSGLTIGVFVYLISRPKDWVTQKQQLYKHFSEGRVRIDAAFKELQKLGFIRGVKKKKPDGRFGGYDWLVYDYPQTENCATESRLSENQQTVIEQLINKDIPNKDIVNKEIMGGKSKKKFKPPTKQEVIDYFAEKNYSRDAAIKMFDGYDVANWKDSRGNQVRNWKQKAIHVWFKPENKVVGAGNSTFDINNY